jgi:hypothetical protein
MPNEKEPWDASHHWLVCYRMTKKVNCRKTIATTTLWWKINIGNVHERRGRKRETHFLKQYQVTSVHYFKYGVIPSAEQRTFRSLNFTPIFFPANFYTWFILFRSEKISLFKALSVGSRRVGEKEEWKRRENHKFWPGENSMFTFFPLVPEKRLLK